ncbi:hypothetical protein CFOL_v3_07173 [Cephalotus follicularis]|uniref:Uncharacterized protein n=1 Tax=Cephalotus follicularis TaxID=3775 RepID=A0A1Q3B6X9_CEPFO|nr:hypothetical protein CFOL_v3_07173 [Cephalotus follicularis]
MKRKDFEDVKDDFSSPSRKSRRLDGEFLSCMQDAQIIIAPETEILEQVSSPGQQLTEHTAVDSMPLTEERALVLYNPGNTPFLKSPSSPEFALVVNSDSILGLKDHLFWSGFSTSMKRVEVEVAKDTYLADDCLAVVPWVAPQFPLASGLEGAGIGLPDPMESEELEVEMMDIEDPDNNGNIARAFEIGGTMEGADGLPQWLQRQQHCTDTSAPPKHISSSHLVTGS